MNSFDEFLKEFLEKSTEEFLKKSMMESRIEVDGKLVIK